MFYNFSCFLSLRFPGVNVFYIHPTGRKELIVDGQELVRQHNEAPDPLGLGQWLNFSSANKEVHSWGGQAIIRLEPVPGAPHNVIKLSYMLAL